MELNLNLIRKYLSCCLNCGSFLIEESGFCRECTENLDLLSSQNDESLGGLTVKTYYQWKPGESDTLSKLILWLKGPRQKNLWHFYSLAMVKKRLSELEPGVKIYVVPAPARKEGIKDHAYHWAEGLAEALGADFVTCLKKPKGLRSQRGQDRGERALIELEVHENYTNSVDFSAQALWIFADDIVTTGATARAAHIALGRPERFQVWALARRGSLAGRPRI